jgi:methyl-accepting chemotaxis protein
MKKIFFSLKNFRRLNYIFFILSAVFTIFWGLGIYFFSFSFIAFSKGASLLMVYIEEYYYVRVLPNEVTSKKLVRDVEEKFGGFIVFYDLLNFKDRDYQEIREVWRNFGMNDSEIFIVVVGTKVFRVVPGLMDEIKDAANELYDNINNLSTTFSEEEFNKIRSSSKKFLESLMDTMRRIVIYFAVIVGVAVIYWVLGFGFFIIRYVERLKIIIDALSKSMLSYVKEGKTEKIDIVDERSKECLFLQDATNLIIDKGKSLNEAISAVENQLVTIVEVIETNSYSIYEVKIAIENLISELSNLDRSSIEQNISNLTRTFSVLQKYAYDIKEMFEDFRSKSQNLFEPIETLYEIISKASEDYDQISKTIISYLRESNVFSKTISDALKKQYEKLSEIIDSLRRIALNLKNVGINATVEFSRLSSSEALFQISRKIIDTSKNLQDLVLNSSIFIDEVRNDISQTLKKIDSFYSIVSELFNDMQNVSDTVESLISDKERVIDNIRHNYNIISSISGILSEIEKITANMNSVYYSLESNIKSLLELVNLGEQVKPVLDVLDTTYSSLIEIKYAFVRVVENLRRYK